jgi:hypothetical protein
MVNRLIGMNELAIRLLQDSEDSNAKIVAESLGRVIPWFTEDVALDRKALPSPRDEPTP